MKHPIAPVAGTTTRPGYAAARALAGGAGAGSLSPDAGWLGPRKRQLSSRLRPKCRFFTPLELAPDSPFSVQSALAELVKRGRPVDFLLLNAGRGPGKKHVFTEAGVEAQAPLSGHHQLTFGLLHSASN